MKEGDKWTLKNQAGYHDKTSEGKTDHGDPSSLKKESGIKDQGGNVNYSTSTSVKYDDIKDGYLYYRLILTTSSDHNEVLTLTDNPVLLLVDNSASCYLPILSEYYYQTLKSPAA